MGETSKNRLDDSLALSMLPSSKFYTWINDFIAPFYNFIRVSFHSKIVASEMSLNKGTIKYSSEIELNYLKKSKIISRSELTINETGITAFEYTNDKIKMKATCINL